MIVYLITNLFSGKVYVGQTTLDLRKKFAWYLSGKKVPPLLNRAIQKYGPSNFDIQEVARAANKKELDELEKLWISILRSSDRDFGYNLTLGGTGGVPNLATKEILQAKALARFNGIDFIGSIEAKDQLRQRALLRGTAHLNTPEARRRKGESLKGRIFSDDTRKKMSESAKRRAGTLAGKNHLQNARAARGGQFRDGSNGRFSVKPSVEGGNPSA